MTKNLNSDFQMLTLRINDPTGLGYTAEFNALFDFDLNLLDDPSTRPENLKAPMEKLIKCIQRCSGRNWNLPMLSDSSENAVVLDLVKNIFSQLFENIEVEKKTSLLLKIWMVYMQSTLVLADLVQATWHGSADI